MPTVQFSVSGTQKLRIRTGRKPLRPKNISSDLDSVQIKAKPEWIETSRVADSNKENHPACATPVKMELFDASLAEELSAMRKRRERLRIEEEKVEKMLRERDLVLEMWMKEVKKRAEEQKKLEMEVDRLFRLKELRSAVRISPIRPLREREREKKTDTAQPQASPFRRRSVLFLRASMDGSASPSPSQSPRLGSDRSNGIFLSSSPSPSPRLGSDRSKGTFLSPSPSPTPSPSRGSDRSKRTMPSPSPSSSLSLDSSEIGKAK